MKDEQLPVGPGTEKEIREVCLPQGMQDDALVCQQFFKGLVIN